MKIDQQELSLYLQAIKAAFEKGNFSESDCRHLTYLYTQGGLYASVLVQDALLDASAKVGIAKFVSAIRENLEAPVIDADTDISHGLTRNVPCAAADRLPQEFVVDSDRTFREFLAHLLSGIQADIVGLSVEAEALPPTGRENAHYVIGMLEVTAQNLGAVFEGPDGYTRMKPSELAKFFEDSCHYVASIKRELVH